MVTGMVTNGHECSKDSGQSGDRSAAVDQGGDEIGAVGMHRRGVHPTPCR